MNPGEKAKELVDKYIPLVEAFTEIGRLENAKKCALIAVDEMIWLSNLYSESDYWQEVKQQIQNYETNI